MNLDLKMIMLAIEMRLTCQPSIQILSKFIQSCIGAGKISLSNSLTLCYHKLRCIESQRQNPGVDTV